MKTWFNGAGAKCVWQLTGGALSTSYEHNSGCGCLLSLLHLYTTINALDHWSSAYFWLTLGKLQIYCSMFKGTILNQSSMSGWHFKWVFNRTFFSVALNVIMAIVSWDIAVDIFLIIKLLIYHYSYILCIAYINNCILITYIINLKLYFLIYDFQKYLLLTIFAA